MSQEREFDKNELIKDFNSRQSTQYIPYTLPVKEKSNIIIEISKMDNIYSYSVINRL